MVKINGTKTLPYQPPQPQTNKTCNTVPRNFYKRRLPEDSGSLFLRSTLFQRRLRRFPLQMPLHIAGKRFSVRQHLGAEHAPAQESGQVYIERAKMLSHGVFAAVGQQGLQGMQRGIEIAVAEGTAPFLALRHLTPAVENGVFELRTKQQPAVVLPALRSTRSRDQPSGKSSAR